MLRKHLLHLAHLFHKSEQLLSNRSHRRKPYNLFQDRKNWHFLFNKQTQIGAAVAGLVAVIAFAWFFFFQVGQV